MSYIVTDGDGYYCGSRVEYSGPLLWPTRRVDLWSRDRSDAKTIHLREVAARIIERLPFAAEVIGEA